MFRAENKSSLKALELRIAHRQQLAFWLVFLSLSYWIQQTILLSLGNELNDITLEVCITFFHLFFFFWSETVTLTNVNRTLTCTDNSLPDSSDIDIKQE